MDSFLVLLLVCSLSVTTSAQDAVYGQYDLAAVATDGRPCAEIGT